MVDDGVGDFRHMLVILRAYARRTIQSQNGVYAIRPRRQCGIFSRVHDHHRFAAGVPLKKASQLH